MSPMAIVENALCETYEGLVADCQGARNQWNERRSEIAELALRGKGIDDELRRLQAKFAKSYAMVRAHLRDCDSCQLAGRTDYGAGHKGYGRLIPEFRLAFFSCAQSSGV